MEVTLARTTEEGSRVLVWASLGGADNLKKLQGAYISTSRIEEPSDYVLSEEGIMSQNKIWVRFNPAT